MRPIKFRAFRKNEKEMWPAQDICFYDSPTREGNMGEVFPPGSKTSLYFPEECELMQFTGLLDKNGKEIYEGDIVLSDIKGDKPREVKFSIEDDTQYGQGDSSTSRCAGFFLWSYGNSPVWEVVGNIYENPELLK